MVLALLLIGLFNVSPSAGRQEAPSDSGQLPEFKSGIDLVAVDVVVVDSDGRPIPNLAPTDFAVTVDGRSRRVMSADFVVHRLSTDPPEATDLAAAQPPATALNTIQAAGRLIAIVVDLDHISAGLGRDAFSAAGRFLERLNPEDRVAVLTIPTGGPKVDFTTNRQQVRTALDLIAGRAVPDTGEFAIGIAEALDIERGDRLTVDEVVSRECDGSRYGPQCPRLVLGQASKMAREEQWATQATLDALVEFSEALGTVEGPKTIVLLTEGLVRTRETRFSFRRFATAAAAASLNVYVVALDGGTRPIITASRNTRASALSRDLDVKLEGLNELAGMARGALVRMSGTGDAAFDRIATELSGYYLLGFEAQEGDRDGSRHQIKVTSTRGAELRARAEFLVPQDDATLKALDARARLTRLLRLPGIVAGLPLRLAAYAVRDSDPTKVRILTAAEVGGEPVAEPVEADIGLEIRTDDGRIVSDSLDHETLTRGQADGALLYLSAVVVEPGTYTLKLAALLAQGASGTVELPLDASRGSNGGVQISNVILGSAPGGRFRASPSAGERGAEVVAFIEVYSSDPERLGSVTVDFEVSVDLNAPALARATGTIGLTDDATRIVASGAPDLNGIDAGTYVVRAVVFEGMRETARSARCFVRR